MTDYDLAGLSTRSFEQLIQAIAAKVIGPSIVIFGDGPDGAREATFEGGIPYPNKESDWEGYLVVQAKFRKRSEGSKKDGEWVLRQLRSELEKFVDPKRKLCKPEYYILATNVVLTPVHKRGSKDKAYALLEEFKEPLGLKGYDVWDYDKICAFLDSCEGIRRAYAAWITSGDVLAEVIEWLELCQPDFEETMTNFLQKQLLADQYVNLEQAGHAVEDRIPLARVFVDLPTFDERRLEPPDEQITPAGLPPGFIAEALDVAAQRLDPASLGRRAGYESAGQETSKPRGGRFVLIGGPGQGKTTVAQFICQLFRTAILRKRSQESLAPEVRQALALIEDQCRTSGMEVPSAARFPLYIALSDFAAKLASEEGGHVTSLLSYVVKRIKKRTDRQVSVDDFREWLAGYPWIVVLDGLDEVPASSNRDEVLAAVHGFWIDATERNADVLVVATTRPQGYNEDYSPDLYQHKWLAPLSTARAMHYADRLAQVRYGNDPDRCEKVLTGLKRASTHEATARLMRSPLQVTIMTTLVDRMGRPPQERWNLFKEYYNVIYQREVERDVPAATILRNYRPDIDAIHSRVGLLLQVESERSGRTDACLSSQCFANVVEGRLVEEGHEGQQLSTLKENIIEAATQRLVFLVGLEADKVGFELRSLQEFMAAQGLMEGEDQVVRERLREIAPIVSWRNVFLLAAGKCFAERQHLRDTIHTVCAELNEDPADEVARVTLVGSQLALDVLEDGPARRQPKYSQSLARLALRLLNLPPSACHTRLADVYEPALEPVYRQELERCLAQRNLVHRLGAWACVTVLVDSAVPWAKDMAEAHWPTDNFEQSQLVRLTLTGRGGSSFVPRLASVLTCIPFEHLYAKRGGQGLSLYEGIRQPVWLPAAVRCLAPGYQRSEAALRLPEMQEADILSCPFQAVGREAADWLVPLKHAQSPCSDWKALAAAARFSESPSKSTLARELGAIAELSAPAGYRVLLPVVPWPLGACLGASSSRDELLQMANRAEAGGFGDLRDWQAAEQRWLTHGIALDDIAYITNEHWPLGRDVARAGFPFAIGWYRATYTPALGPLVQKLLDVQARSGRSHMRS